MNQKKGVYRKYKVFPRTLVMMIAFGWLVAPTVTYAGPALYWWHAPFEGTQSQCVSWAQQIMPGHDNNPNGARHFTAEESVVVKCINQAGKPLAVLIYASNSGTQAKNMFDALKKRMFDTTPR